MASTTSKPLERKITEDEAMNGYLLVEKAWLKRLPEPGKSFYLKLGKSDLKVAIEAVPCATHCKGPDKPHDHYHLNLPLVTLVTGTKATLRPINESRVVLDIEE